jgi:hypothetical protein
MLALVLAATVASAPAANPRRDFDFESGTWTIQVRRLAHPLSGSTTWLQPSGYRHIVRKLWDGASLAQLEATKPAPHFMGLMLRMFDEKTQKWSVYWGSADSGALDPPLIGTFANGRGEFQNHESIDGRDVLVRVVYSDITPTSFKTEQAFSADGGKTWETNLIQTFARIK